MLRWEQVPRETQNVVDPIIFAEFGLVAENPKEVGKYWCACQQVAVGSSRVVISRFNLWFRIENAPCAVLEGVLDGGSSVGGGGVFQP